MSETSMQTRIIRLEREARRGRVILTLCVGLLAFALLSAQGKHPPASHLVGRSLTLTDEAGRTRLKIQFDAPEGELSPVALRMFDEKGREWLSADERRGSAFLNLTSTINSGGAQLSLDDHSGEGGVTLNASSIVSSISLTEKGKTRAEIKSVRHGPCGLLLSDREFRHRLGCIVAPKGEPAIYLLDESRRVRTTLGAVVIPETDGERSTDSYAVTVLDSQQERIASLPKKK